MLFDSLEVPAKCMTRQNESDISAVDLSFAKGVLLCEIFNETVTISKFAN